MEYTKGMYLYQLALLALLLAACAAPPEVEVREGPPAGAATYRDAHYLVEAPGARACDWVLAPRVAGSAAQGSCEVAGPDRFACVVEFPAPGLYDLVFTATGPGGVAHATVERLDHRPRYGGAYPPLDDGSSGIASGWGAWGGNAVAEPVVHEYPEQGTVTIYRPEVIPARRPTVFFVSGWGRDAATYEQLFRYVASKGFVLVNVYNENPGDIRSAYPNALAMIEDALARVPADTRVLLQAYEEDFLTDPDVYQLVFRLLPTAAGEKDFVWVRSGEVGGRAYRANHFTSYTGAWTQWDPVHYEPYDLLDAYALNRLLDAMLAYVFDGDADAQPVALGGGGPDQVAMGPLPELVVTDAPDFHDPNVAYDYVCRDDDE